MQVVDGRDILHGHVAELVGRAVAVGAFHAGARQPDGEALRVVVAAVGPALEGGHATEFGDEGDERVLEQPAALEVLEQCGGGLVQDGRVDGVLVGDPLVAIPVADPFAHGVGTVEELDEAHPFLQQSPGEDAVPREARLVRVGVVGPVQRARRGRLAGKVGQRGRLQLHARRQFVGGDPRGEVGVARIPLQVAVIEAAQELTGGLVGFRRDPGWPGQVGDGALGAERRALEGRRQEGAVPMARTILGDPARVGDGHERRQVLVLAAQRVGHPGAHARESIEGEARAHLALRRAMRVRLPRHRMDEAHLVGQVGEVRE